MKDYKTKIKNIIEEEDEKEEGLKKDNLRLQKENDEYKKMGFDPLKKITIYIYTEDKDENDNEKKIKNIEKNK